MNPTCSGLQIRTECFAAVEYKTVATIMRAADFLDLLQDAALQLINALDTDFLHVDRGLFTANAAGTK